MEEIIRRQSEMIKALATQVAELKRENEKLGKDNEDLKTYLYLALAKCGTVRIDRKAEPVTPSFVLDENIMGDMLIRIR